MIRVILSGCTDAENIIRGVDEAGIYRFIIKPWHPGTAAFQCAHAARPHHLQLKNKFRLDSMVESRRQPLDDICEQEL